MKAARAEDRFADEKGLKRSYSVDDPEVWFGFDTDGQRTARHVQDLAAAIRRGDLAEADMCLDLIGRENGKFAEQVALGRTSRGARPC
jgi:hypothetical protein